MYVIIWEYQVKPDRVAEFEEAYAAQGAWARFFQRHPGYLGTELLHDPGDPQRYITMDRWDSSKQYESFLAQWATEYAALDAQFEGLTEKEFLSSTWESISSETR
jgi:heme-degrading monooxygenase HmoA